MVTSPTAPSPSKKLFTRTSSTGGQTCKATAETLIKRLSSRVSNMRGKTHEMTRFWYTSHCPRGPGLTNLLLDSYPFRKDLTIEGIERNPGPGSDVERTSSRESSRSGSLAESDEPSTSLKPLLRYRHGLKLRDSRGADTNTGLTVVPTFRSYYRSIDYNWSDPCVVTVKWDKTLKPDVKEIELPRGYYELFAASEGGGNSSFTLSLHQPITPTPLVDVLVSFPYVTVHHNSVRFTVSHTKGTLVPVVLLVGKSTKDLAGSVVLRICQREFAAKPFESTVNRIGAIGVLEQITSKDLGRAVPMWVSQIPQSGWKRDLTAEGIESNPGPASTHLQLLIDRGQANKDVENVLACLTVAMEMVDENPFNLLLALDADDIPTYDSLALEEPLTPAKQSGAGKPRMRLDGDEGGRGSRKPPSPTDTGSQREAVVQRLGKKFAESSGDKMLFIRWLAKVKPNIKLVRDIAKVVYGQNWYTIRETSPELFTVYCYCNRISNQEIFDTAIEVLVNDSFKAEFCGPLFTELTGSPYISGAARMHNKKMHALNGNIFIESFDDVKSAPNWKAVATAAPGVQTSGRTIADYETYFTGYSKLSAPTVTDLRDFDGIKDDYVSTTNQIIQGKKVRFPCSPLKPVNLLKFRQPPPPPPPTLSGTSVSTGESSSGGSIPAAVSSTSAASTSQAARGAVSYTRVGDSLPVPPHGVELFKDPSPLEYVSFTTAEYRSNMLTDTSKAKEIKLLTQNAASVRFRATDIDSSGYLSLDVFGLAKEATAKGFNLEAPVLRLLLLSDALAIDDYRAYVPKSIFSNVDGVLDWDPDSIGSYYNAPNYDGLEGEHQFPFVGGNGTIRFHLSLETVEPQRRSAAVFAPPFLFQTSRDPQIQFFLFILSLCEWPTGIFSFSARYVRERDPPINITQAWIHRASLTRVPGPIDLDIIIPRRTSERKPQTQAECERLAQIVPHNYYVVPSPDPAPGNLLFTTDVNNQKDNNLTEYINSYITEIAAMDVYNYLSTLNLNFGIEATVEACLDLVAGANYGFPMLLDSSELDGFPGALDWFGESVAASSLFTKTATPWMGLRETVEYSNLPLTKARKPSAVIFEFSYQAWNKVVLGLSVSEDTAPSASMELSPLICNPKQVYWMVLKAMTLAITSQTFFSTVGLSAAAWDEAATSKRNRAMQKMAFMTYCTELCPSILKPPKLAKVFTSIHQHLFSVPLATIQYKDSQSQYPITFFSRQVLPSKFPKVIKSSVSDNAIEASDLYTPSIVVDVFINVMAEKPIKFQCNMLPAYATKGTMGFSSGLAPKHFPRSAKMGPYVDTTTLDGVAATNKLFSLSDEHMWNNRLLMTSGTMEVVDNTGTVVEEKYGDICPRQRNQFHDTPGHWATDMTPDCTNRTQTAGCCTTTFPSITKHALLPIPVVDATRRMPLSRAMQQCGTIARECWRLNGCALMTDTEMESGGDDFWSGVAASDFRDVASVTPDLNPRAASQATAMPQGELAPPDPSTVEIVPS